MNISPDWIKDIAIVLGPISLVMTLYIQFFQRKRDVSSTIDVKNVTAQKEYIVQLEKDKLYLEGEVKVRDEQILNLKKTIEDNKKDTQRQIDGLTQQILDIKKSNSEISTISETLKIFIPLTNDIQVFHQADKDILDGIRQIMKSQGITDHRNGI